MSYIGKEPINGNFSVADAITTSSTATYALTVGSVAFTPESVNHCIVSLNGVIQAPTSAFTISGTNIVFNSALTSADVIDFIYFLGHVNDIGTPSDNTVSQAKLVNESVNEAKMQISNAGSNGEFLSKQSGNTGGLTWAAVSGFDVSSITGATALAEEPDPADEMVISDGGTLKRLDMKHMMCRPAFYAARQTAATLGDTFGVMSLTSERFDTDGCFDHSSTFRFTPVVPGMYYLAGGISWNTSSDFDKGEIAIYENGSDVVAYGSFANRDDNIMICSTIINTVDADDYFDLRAKSGESSSAALGGVPKQFFYGFRLLGGGN